MNISATLQPHFVQVLFKRQSGNWSSNLRAIVNVDSAVSDKLSHE